MADTSLNLPRGHAANYRHPRGPCTQCAWHMSAIRTTRGSVEHGYAGCVGRDPSTGKCTECQRSTSYVCESVPESLRIIASDMERLFLNPEKQEHGALNRFKRLYRDGIKAYNLMEEEEEAAEAADRLASRSRTGGSANAAPVIHSVRNPDMSTLNRGMPPAEQEQLVARQEAFTKRPLLTTRGKRLQDPARNPPQINQPIIPLPEQQGNDPDLDRQAMPPPPPPPPAAPA